jgi:hypothetical protein
VHVKHDNAELFLLELDEGQVGDEGAAQEEEGVDGRHGVQQSQRGGSKFSKDELCRKSESNVATVS